MLEGGIVRLPMQVLALQDHTCNEQQSSLASDVQVVLILCGMSFRVWGFFLRGR